MATLLGYKGRAVAIHGKAFVVSAGGSAPGQPTLSASAGNGQVTLTWTDPPGIITQRYLAQSTTSGGETTYNPITLSGGQFVVTGLTNGTQYYFKGKCANGVSTGSASAEVNATPLGAPGAPTLSATAGNGQVTITWTDPPGSVTQRYLAQATVPGGETTFNPIALTGGRYVVTGLTNGTEYFFEGKCANAAGTGIASSEVNATPSATALAAPAIAVAPLGSQNIVSWTDPAGVSGITARTLTRVGSDSSNVTIPITPKGLTVGVYQGNAIDGINQLPFFTNWLGRQPDQILDFIAQDNWANFNSDTGYTIGYWAGQATNLCISVPLNTQESPDFASIVNGSHDADFQNVATYMKNDFPNGIVRLGWEQNGGWYPWGNLNSSDANGPRLPQYISAFQHVVSTMRAIAPGLKFFWCYNGGNGQQIDNDASYPGDAYVDIVGFDYYARSNTYDRNNPTWLDCVNCAMQGWQLDFIQSFAASHGKAWAIGEFGIGYQHADYDVGPEDRGDLAAWWMQQFSMYPVGLGAGQLAFINLWDVNESDDASKVSIGQRPNLAASYKAFFQTGGPLTYTDTTTSEGVTYTYTGTVTNGSGTSSPSTSVLTTPLASPAGTVATPTTKTTNQVATFTGTASGIGMVYAAFSQGAGDIGFRYPVPVVNNAWSWTTSAPATAGTNTLLTIYTLAQSGSIIASSSDFTVTSAAATTPDAPYLSITYNGANAATLTWWDGLSNGGATVSTRKLYQATTPGGETTGTPITLASAPLAGTGTYALTGTTGQVLYFKGTSTNTAGESAKSNEISFTFAQNPVAPTITATAGPGAGQVTISCPTANGGGQPSVLKYLYASSNSATILSNAPIAVIPASTTSYVASGLGSGTRQYFQMCEQNDYANSNAGAKWEAMGSTDGTTKTFTYSAWPIPIQPGTVNIVQTDSNGNNTYIAQDNGSGTLSGLNGVTLSGTVNYVTGAVSVTFATAPASGLSLNFIYTYGLSYSSAVSAVPP